MQAILAAAVLVSGCGGGGSSSGSDNLNNFTGTYEGGGDTDFTIGSKTDNNYVPTKIIIRSDESVAASDGSAKISTSGKLNGETFETSGKFISDDALICDMTFAYTGSIRLDNGIETVTGKVSGSGMCNGEASSVTGVYTAMKISDVAKSPVNSGFIENFYQLSR